MSTDSLDYKSNNWEDILFQGKNQQYGAYQLRKQYSKRINIATVAAIAAFVFFLLLPQIIEYLKPAEVVEEAPVKIVTVNELDQPPPMQEELPPPPQMDIPPPVRKQIKFVPPEVSKETIVEEEEIPTIEEVKEAEISTVTTEGVETVFEEPEAVSGLGDAPVDDNQVFTVVEQQPEFPGGTDALYKFIGKNMRYPESAKRMNVEGRVFVSFVIEKDGSVTDVQVMKGIHQACDAEAIRVIKSIPAWKAGKQNGRPVRVRFSLPIQFKLG